MQRQAPTPHTRKRTHLKPSQVALLQESFVTNALPDAAKRSHLARALEVSERTVQIWFQNRRAKARKSEAYSLGQEMTSLMPNVHTGWIEPPKLNKPNGSSFSNRFRSASSRPDVKTYNRNDNVLPTCILTTRAISEGTDSQQVVPHLSIPVNTLRIGSWARFMSLSANNEWDLVCYFHLLKKKMIWQVQEGGVKFRIEVDFDQISQIRLGSLSTKQQLPSLSTSTSTTSTSTSSSSIATTPPAPGPSTTTLGQLQIHVASPHQVQFSMCQADKEDWVQCADFSEHTQASVEPVHILQGNHDALKHILIDISTRLPELVHKVVFLNPVAGTPEHHPIKNESMLPEASTSPYVNHRSWLSDTKSFATTISFDEYMQLFQQQPYPAPSMFI